MGDRSPLAASKIIDDAASPALGRDARLRGAAALVAMGLAAGGAGELSYDQLKQRFRSAMARDSIDSLATLILGGGYLFYLAERGENPRCATVLDAVLFLSTCVSVGYAQVHACTPAGKAIASFVMAFGPALAASALGAPAGMPSGAQDQNRAILERLDAILEALRAPR
ncbi:ion channel [Sorangium cellulosum]|uniref:ion channel n=1 Tax=Sorangium cellulosum TaxID=56 RepID=UPI000CF540E0|nr:ion channel [Sorangium cellulosum]